MASFCHKKSPACFTDSYHSLRYEYINTFDKPSDVCSQYELIMILTNFGGIYKVFLHHAMGLSPIVTMCVHQLSLVDWLYFDHGIKNLFKMGVALRIWLYDIHWLSPLAKRVAGIGKTVTIGFGLGSVWAICPNPTSNIEMPTSQCDYDMDK